MAHWSELFILVASRAHLRSAMNTPQFVKERLHVGQRIKNVLRLSLKGPQETETAVQTRLEP